MFTAEWARRHARERLGIDADEMDGGHYITLSRPRELADRLVAYAEGARRERGAELRGRDSNPQPTG